MPPVPFVSNSRADRAGERFRAWATADGATRRVTLEATADELVAISQYRAMHAYPLRKVNVGVRQMIQTELGDSAPRPTQRFKRADRILRKLLRYPHMRLSQMEDIGGCRAVFETLDNVYVVTERVMRRWGHRARLTDFIDAPKPDGYRGIHIVEKRDGRLIEVQLRTEGQHAWASAVENVLPLTGFNLKDGDGPDDLKEYFWVAAERIARQERGEAPDPELEERITMLRTQVRPYFTPDTAS